MPLTTQNAYPSLTSLGRITTQYGGRTAYEKFHPGLDIANREGTQIPAFASGVVKAIKQNQKGYGNSVVVMDNKGNNHAYSHLKASFVKPGQKVKKGQPIAQMGATGGAYSPSGGDASHLDYRIVSAYGRYKNPYSYIKSFLPKQ